MSIWHRKYKRPARGWLRMGITKISTPVEPQAASAGAKANEAPITAATVPASIATTAEGTKL